MGNKIGEAGSKAGLVGSKLSQPDSREGQWTDGVGTIPVLGHALFYCPMFKRFILNPT